MKITTKEDLAAVAAQEWKIIYPDFASTAKKLEELGPRPTPEAVEGVIGNGSWTEILCSECLKNVPTITFGCTLTVQVCKECLETASSKLEREDHEVRSIS